MTKEKSTLIGKIKFRAPVAKMSDEEKTAWKHAGPGRIKKFMEDMERLQVGAKVDIELVHPETKEVFVRETFTTTLYKPKVKK